jgi:TatD DNase family protein
MGEVYEPLVRSCGIPAAAAPPHLPSPVIDTHCHLTFPDFHEPKMPGGVAGVLERARREGVTGAITISTTTADCLEALKIAESFDNVWCTAGVHPLHSDEGPHTWANLKTVAQRPKCVAWGELGLDNHYNEPLRSVQDAVLAEQLAFIESCAREGIVKPVVIHCREAFADLLPILRRSKLDPSRFVFHCFTGNAPEAREVLDFGAWISFTGVVTYKNAPEVREAACLVPKDRIMVETDAPFLSPDPHRGVRPCQPWMTMVTARKLAEVRGEDFDAFHAQVNQNAQRFFNLPSVPK